MPMPVPWHLWQRTRTAFRLMQDLGALSGALGLRGALAGFRAGQGSSRSPVPPTRPPARLESASTVGFIADQDLLHFIRISSNARVTSTKSSEQTSDPYNIVFPLLERRFC